MVPCTMTKKVPYQVCTMVQETCTKKVPYTVCTMEKYTICKQVPYTVCTQVPYTVTTEGAVHGDRVRALHGVQASAGMRALHRVRQGLPEGADPGDRHLLPHRDRVLWLDLL